MAACSGGERDDGASGLRRTNRDSWTASGPASPAGATRRRSARARSAPAVPPNALVGRARGVAARSTGARRSPASPATPGGRGRTVRSRSPGPRTRRRPATASPDRTTATRSTGPGGGALSLHHSIRSPLHTPHVPVPSPLSGLLADHVEERLALLVTDDLERAGEGVGQGRRVLDAFGVAAGSAAHQLVVGRRLEIGDRHLTYPGRHALMRVRPIGAMVLFPSAGAEDHEQHWQDVRARDEVRPGPRAEDVRAVADAADDRLVGRRELGAERGPHTPAEAAGGGGAEVAARRAETALGRGEDVLVHEDSVFHHEARPP